jgi:vacuolar protein sorting-associated protein 18
MQINNLELAKAIANEEQDEDLRKQLWLGIIEHALTLKHGIHDVIALSKEGDLKIEDILPQLPDFVKIDDLKSELCASLKIYNEHLTYLKSELEDSANSAASIRHDIKELKKRFISVPVVRTCDLTGKQLLTQKFCVFPCQHAFLADALIKEVKDTDAGFERYSTCGKDSRR